MNGVSKAYSMTGWRIGYAAGPADLIEAMCTIQSQSTSNPTSISQYAAEAALTGDQSFITNMCVEFKKRHDYVVAELTALKGWNVWKPTALFMYSPMWKNWLPDWMVLTRPWISDYLIEKQGCVGTRFCIWFRRTYQNFHCHKYGKSAKCFGADQEAI